MQAALRLVSLFLIVIGLVLMGADAVTSLDRGGEATLRSVEQLWASIDTGSLAAFRAWVAGSAPWAVATVETLLHVWGWALTGMLGVFLAFVAGRAVER
ncbi:MAG TPA: hypothetical protein VG889_00135 [Rhizomicrobium sp.]|nr:hypothetical protein [Rhizomicrobium sp.]